MVGGARETFERCRPVFETMGVKIVYAGTHGMGSTLKLVNNLILGVAIHADEQAHGAFRSDLVAAAL